MGRCIIIFGIMDVFLGDETECTEYDERHAPSTEALRAKADRLAKEML